jgi:hypothetical protein
MRGTYLPSHMTLWRGGLGTTLLELCIFSNIFYLLLEDASDVNIKMIFAEGMFIMRYW